MSKKILSLILAAFLIFSTAGCSKQNNAAPPNYNEVQTKPSAYEVGDFNTTDIDGKAVTSDILSGYDLTLVNIWATGCSPCVEEMPYLAELSEEWKDKSVQIISVIVDVTDENGEVMEEYLELAKTIREKANANFPILLPDKVLAEGILNDISGFPETLFVDSSGKLVGSPVSGSMDKAGWEELIAERLAMVQEQ